MPTGNFLDEIADGDISCSTMALRLRQKMSSKLTLVRRFLIMIDRLRLGFGFTDTASNLNSCYLNSATEIGYGLRFILLTIEFYS